MKKRFYYLSGIFILLLVAGSMSQLPASNVLPEENKSMEQDSIIAAKDLYDVFKKDPDAAKELYGGRIMTVKGFAVFVGPDVYGLPSVEVSEKKGGTSRLLCVLPFSDYLKLRKVSKGDEVTMRGEVRGFYEKGDQVLLKQCEIIEEKKETKKK